MTSSRAPRATAEELEALERVRAAELERASEMGRLIALIAECDEMARHYARENTTRNMRAVRVPRKGKANGE